MDDDFAALMSKEDHSFYPLRFMASDYFVPCWKCFIPVELEAEQVQVVQEAARAGVDESMGSEPIYWHIDFSEPRALKTWRRFVAATQALPDDITGHISTLAMKLATHSEEASAGDYTISLMLRLRFDRELQESLGYPGSDADILDAIYEEADDVLLDKGRVEQEWLESQAAWDLRLKSQTPDLQESVYLIFVTAYDLHTHLPWIRDKLRTNLDDAAVFRSFISRLEEAFELSLYVNMDLEFPAVLKT